MSVKNFFEKIPEYIPEEIIETILSFGTFRIERIISKGHSSPKNFWYDQNENEWIFLVRGKSIVKLYDEEMPVELKEGDYLNIPAHTKHRVEWTDPENETIWLAVFY